MPDRHELSDAWQILLQMRENFVHELPARIEKLEQQILDLQNPDDFKSQFSDLLRDTHSLKGAGGTYGLPFVSAVCHHLEEAYVKLDSSLSQLPATHIQHFLEYIDIMKDTILVLESGSDFSKLEYRLRRLKQKRLRGFSALLISASRSVQQLCDSVGNDTYQIEWRKVEDAYQALGLLLQEHFDLIVLSNELARLSGEGVIAAIRLSAGINRQTPMVLISSSDSLTLPAALGADYVVKRDTQFVENLTEALANIARQLAA